MSIVSDLEMSGMRKGLVYGLRTLGWLLFVAVWAAWLGSLGIWVLCSPLGVMWAIALGWVPSEAATAATFTNLGLQLLLFFSLVALAFHHASGLWPFGRKGKA